MTYGHGEERALWTGEVFSIQPAETTETKYTVPIRTLPYAQQYLWVDFTINTATSMDLYLEASSDGINFREYRDANARLMRILFTGSFTGAWYLLSSRQNWSRMAPPLLPGALWRIKATATGAHPQSCSLSLRTQSFETRTMAKAF